MGASMFWLGWMLMPAHIGTFFEPGIFSVIRENFHFWIWMYRVHIFGTMICVMALIALGSLLTESKVRVIAWPGIVVAAVGLVVGTLGTAFYYHHGAWGSLQTNGQSLETIVSFAESLRVDTEYVTCLVRFGKVFFGLGLVALAFGLVKWRVFPRFIGVSAGLLGLSGMALTMAFPDNPELYTLVFHLNSAWFLAAGVVALRSGVRIQE